MDDRMTSDWRSEALDRWLVLDVIVSDHSVDALRTFHKHNEASMLDVDPMEFGMLLCHSIPFSNVINIAIIIDKIGMIFTTPHHPGTMAK